jgi:hypothetical protein
LHPEFAKGGRNKRMQSLRVATGIQMVNEDSHSDEGEIFNLSAKDDQKRR